MELADNSIFKIHQTRGAAISDFPPEIDVWTRQRAGSASDQPRASASDERGVVGDISGWAEKYTPCVQGSQYNRRANERCKEYLVLVVRELA